MIINKLLSSVFINVLVIYIISKYIPQLGFHVSFVNCSLEVYLLIWFVFWVLDEVVKKIVKILTLPLNLLTLGLFSILVNVWFIYIFKYVVNNYFASLANVSVGTFIQVLLVSILIYILNLLLKKL